MADRSTFLDLDGKSRAELLRMKVELGADMDHIRGQLDKARCDYRRTGDRTNEDWFRRAQSVLRIKGRQIQQVQIRIAALRDGRSKLPKLFMKHARGVLDDGVFNAIMDAAVSEINED